MQKFRLGEYGPLATLHSLSIKFSSCEIQLDIYCTCNCDTLQAASRRKVSHFSYPHVGGVFWGVFFLSLTFYNNLFRNSQPFYIYEDWLSLFTICREIKGNNMGSGNVLINMR